jgi:argininosuccinate lyase
MGEELVLWSTEEFGFIRLPDAYSTGSSMLPHKKNPDIAELVRGKSGRAIGHVAGFLATLKGLPLSYNRDLQEDKEPLFDAVATVTGSLSALSGLIAALEFVPEQMQSAADGPSGVATDLAEHLVQQGVPFRDAHAEVGALVRDAADRHVSLQELAAGNARLGAESAAMFAPGEAVRRRSTPGGAGPDPVRTQLRAATERLAEQAEWLSG